MLIGMIVVTVMMPMGAGLAILWVCLPILVAGAAVARGFANLERRTVALLNGTAPPPSSY